MPVRPDREIQVQLEQFTLSQAGIAHLEELDGQTGLLFGDTAVQPAGQCRFPETGLYNLELSYYALPDSAEQISIGILVDGELPYTEANACVLHRRYSNEGIVPDQQGKRPASTDPAVLPVGEDLPLRPDRRSW